MLKDEIKKVLEAYKNNIYANINSDGEIVSTYEMEIYKTQALTRILELVKIPSEEDIECIKSDIDVARMMIEIYEKQGGGYSQKEALKTLIRIAERYSTPKSNGG